MADGKIGGTQLMGVHHHCDTTSATAHRILEVPSNEAELDKRYQVNRSRLNALNTKKLRGDNTTRKLRNIRKYYGNILLHTCLFAQAKAVARACKVPKDTMAMSSELCLAPDGAKNKLVLDRINIVLLSVRSSIAVNQVTSTPHTDRGQYCTSCPTKGGLVLLSKALFIKASLVVVIVCLFAASISIFSQPSIII